MSVEAWQDQTLDRAAVDLLVGARLEQLIDATNRALADERELNRQAFVELVDSLNRVIGTLAAQVMALTIAQPQRSDGNDNDPRLAELERLRLETVGSLADPLHFTLQKIRQAVRDDDGNIIATAEFGPSAA